MNSITTRILVSTLIIAVSFADLTGQEPWRVVGRVHPLGDSMAIAYPGVQIEARFTGTRTLRLKAGVMERDKEAHFNAYLDERALERVEVRGEVSAQVLSDTLDPEETYTLRLVRRTEAWQGVLVFQGFEGDEGMRWLKLDALPVRKMLFIGDSITGGDKSEYLPPTSRYGNHTHNAESAFGWELARRFDAQVHLVSCGGRGVVRNWEGRPDEVNAAQFFERALPDNPESIWDHRDYQPDLTVICLGTNDFSPEAPMDDARFVQEYVALVERVSEVYPGTRVIVASSPMFCLDDLGWGAPRRELLEECLRQVEAHFETANPGKVRFHGMGCYAGTIFDSHPVVAQHQAMADEMEPLIAEMLGW